jgi:RNA 3'-terminal phosphate cyclase (ATP)
LIEVDGKQGEGGGQILRTALTLSACLGKPVTITDIRANRPVPGLRPQHITAARAVGQVCGVTLEDLEVGQTTLAFDPKPIRAGPYALDVGTAGSTSLILQTVALPLALADGPSIVKITGGTHNPSAPCFEYLTHVWAPFMRKVGIPISLGLQRVGFYPRGGGVVVAQTEGHVEPQTLQPVTLTERGTLTSLKGVVQIANLPMNIGYRIREATLSQLNKRHLDPIELDINVVEASDPAGYCLLCAEFDTTWTASVGVSTKGKTPEGAAADAVRDMADFIHPTRSGRAALDPHAGDQVMLPLALIPGPSRFTTSRLTNHCLTNASVIEQLTGRSVIVKGDVGKPGTVTVS